MGAQGTGAQGTGAKDGGAQADDARDTIRIGGAAGYWGDAALATPQLIHGGELDYLVYDYLAEITLSIMARARAAEPTHGYATDFVVAAMAPNLNEIDRRGIRVISNAGGVNPRACAEALRAEIAARGLDLRVAVVLGDDLTERATEFAELREMFSAERFPEAERIASINAYLGAFPIAAALSAGADIVITGRCVDSAVTLAACIHAFGWERDDLDRLAQGSLAGHILECGTQATGGNFTDWELVVERLFEAGYPIAEVARDGSLMVSKPPGTGGLVSIGTVAEQMLYEIGDPSAYHLPDVICDFTGVELEPLASGLIHVSGARGCGVPAEFKVCATWADGYRAGQVWTLIGRDASRKAAHLADAILARTALVLDHHGLPPLLDSSVEIIGNESHFGPAARDVQPREVDLKIAGRHSSAKGIGVFLKEMVGLALTAPPGLTGFAGARPKPTPVVRLFSFLLSRDAVTPRIELDGRELPYAETAVSAAACRPPPAAMLPVPTRGEPMVQVPLEAVALGRSGDKGDKANIGVIARDAAFLPWIADRFTEDFVAASFVHFLEPDQERPVERFYLPGVHALNFLLHRVLGGGGVASLRADPQGKSYAQLLLTMPLPVPRSLVEAYGLACHVIERTGP